MGFSPPHRTLLTGENSAGQDGGREARGGRKTGKGGDQGWGVLLPDPVPLKDRGSPPKSLLIRLRQHHSAARTLRHADHCHGPKEIVPRGRA